MLVVRTTHSARRNCKNKNRRESKELIADYENHCRLQLGEEIGNGTAPLIIQFKKFMSIKIN